MFAKKDHKDAASRRWILYCWLFASVVALWNLYGNYRSQYVAENFVRVNGIIEDRYCLKQSCWTHVTYSVNSEDFGLYNFGISRYRPIGDKVALAYNPNQPEENYLGRPGGKTYIPIIFVSLPALILSAFFVFTRWLFNSKSSS